MRNALSFIALLTVVSGLHAAEQSDVADKADAASPPPDQLSIFVGGKGWDSVSFAPQAGTKTQIAKLHTRERQAISAIMLQIPKAEYTCIYKDSLLGNDKTETVTSGSCPSVTPNIRSLYLTSLTVQSTDPAYVITPRCWFNVKSYDQAAGESCSNTADDRWIRAVEVTIEPVQHPGQ